jgi:antirestriction protein
MTDQPPTTPTPRVWVGCLACYNAGRLTGAWFDALDAPQEMPEFNQAIAGTLVRPDHSHARTCADIHEELWVFDHEGFAGLLTGECSPCEAAQLAELITELTTDGYPVAAFAAYRDNVGADYATVDDFRDAYCGEYDTEADYAELLADDLGALSTATTGQQWPLSCIDWHQAWPELHYGGDNYSTAAPDGGVYIFRAA